MIYNAVENTMTLSQVIDSYRDISTAINVDRYLAVTSTLTVTSPLHLLSNEQIAKHIQNAAI